MENLREQIKDLEINNLRCLNNYLCQTIDLLSHKSGQVGQGISHSPYFGVPCPPFNFMGGGVFPGAETAWGGGISHSPYSMQQTPFGMPGYSPTYPYVVDWFGGMQRTGLNHTQAPMGWQPWYMEQVRQQQIAQARQGFEAFCRGVYGC
jgi:hypothetical protein